MLRRFVCAVVALAAGGALLAEAVHLGARLNSLLVVTATAAGLLAAAGLSKFWREMSRAGADIDRWIAEAEAGTLARQAEAEQAILDTATAAQVRL
ncbi:hypothetical protein GCM10010199_25630 [Dactylosporangium roseum]